MGSGPIVIGQACEFDYSGTQACKALMKEGLEVILVNSNPATIMTDPEIASKVYIEPLKTPFVEKIIEKERPDAIIPTLGGQTALNLALDLDKAGVLKKYNVRMLGANPEVIRRAEDREEFRDILDSVGAKYARSEMVTSFEQGMEVCQKISFPLILRPNYTLGGGGGGVCFSLEEYQKQLALALQESPTSEVLVEESLLGWKEFELEVMRDKAGTFVVICSIENIDPCGVHTGDSITVAPQQTLTDQQYQEMRMEAKAILDAVGVETGGANIQFAVHPQTGARVVIEMNPRVSRSSALASKATGFPIAKLAALLAIGYRLDEITNDITGTTPCCYEPALDYVVTKIPRFAFEKFSGSKDLLTTQMKSVGEVMGIGRTFKESLMKAVSSLEWPEQGFKPGPYVESKLSYPNSMRLHAIADAFMRGMSVEKVAHLTQITPWFLEQMADIVAFQKTLEETRDLSPENLRAAKRMGLSDHVIGKLTGKKETDIRQLRHQLGVRPSFLQVDTCAGEFASETPYYYSTYWGASRVKSSEKPKVAILGSGPNRIGQGIEFDYGCVRAVRQFQAQGYEVVMINSNPETVSTDYDTSDELYFEPLTAEFVLEILHFVKPQGVVVQLGGQTPINLAPAIDREGFKILGSSLKTIDLAEDRKQFAKVCKDFDFKNPSSGMAANLEEAREVVANIGYPVMCRPSYVLGGRRMEVVENEEDLVGYFARHGHAIGAENPSLIDEFLAGALEVDVDIVRGKDWSVIIGIIEHIEAAGVHSGDSMGVLPPQRLKPETCQKIEELSLRLAEKMDVIGHLNLQLAIKNDQIYMLEANPRSSRSVPFVAKAAGIPAVDLGVRAVLGHLARDVHPESYRWKEVDCVSVKGVVFPFKKFPEADSILGPEMKSTGESMGRGEDFSEALLKAFISSQLTLPKKGEVFFSLRDKDKTTLLPVAKELVKMGYSISATHGTAVFFEENGLRCNELKKVHEGRPHCVDHIRSGNVAFVINTTTGRRAIEASFGIRRSCIDFSIPCITESDVAEAFLLALKKQQTGRFSVEPLKAKMKR